MKLRDFSVTPNKITELSCCEVFVFGSNLKTRVRDKDCVKN